MAETGVYNAFKRRSAEGDILMETTPLTALLYTSGYIPISTGRVDQEFVLNAPNSSESVDAFELSTVGGAYDRQTIPSTSITITQVNARDAIEIDAPDVTFFSISSSAGVAAGMAVFAELAPSDSSGRVLSTFYDFDTPISPNGGDIVVQFSTGGILELLASTSDAS